MIRKQFIDADSFQGLAQIIHPFKKVQQILGYLIELSIEVGAREEYDFNSLLIKAEAKFADRTYQIFSNSLTDFQIDYNDLIIKTEEIKDFEKRIGTQIQYPQMRSVRNTGENPTFYNYVLYFPFNIITNAIFSYNTGLIQRGDIYIQIQTGKTSRYVAYAITKDYVAETPFVVLQKIPFKPVATEKQFEILSTNKITYFSEGEIDTANENIDLLTYPTKEEFLTNIMKTGWNTLNTAAGGSLSRIYFNSVLLEKGNYFFVINPNPDITEDRFLLIRRISNQTIYQPPQILPVPPQAGLSI